MLEKIGSSVKSIGSKVLILLIALSFAVWGIGDIFTGNDNPTVASIGKSEIKLKTFNLEYQSIIDSLRRSSDDPISEELIKAMGVHTTVLNNMINQEYIGLLSKDAGINISEKYIKRSIFRNPLFQDQLGVFNKDYLNYFLNRNNISEQELLKINKSGLVNDIFISTINYSEYIPLIITDNIIKKRNLTRKAYIYEVDTSTNIITEKLTNNILKKKYNEIKSSLLNPEKREINLVFIDKESINQEIIVDEKDLLDIYNKNIESYKNPEKRKIYQIIFETRDNAEIFYNSYKNRADFYNYLKEKNINKESISLGNVSRGQLEKNLEILAFDLKEETITIPVESSFGWKVLFLEKIIPQQEDTFLNAKNQIREKLVDDLINEKIYNKANLFYEKFLETNDFSNAIEFAGLTNKKFKDISLNNIKKLYKYNKLKIKENDLIKIIFNLNQNTISDPIDNADKSIVFFHINKVTEAQSKNFIEAKEEVINIVYKDKKREKAFNLAEEILEKIKNNEKVINSNYTFTTSDWLTLDAKIKSEIDPKIKKIIFSTKLNTFSKINQLDEFRFFFIKPYDQSTTVLTNKNKSSLEIVGKEIDASIDNDLLNAMLEDIKLIQKPKVNQQFLDSF